jgi:hypothetical protein
MRESVLHRLIADAEAMGQIADHPFVRDGPGVRNRRGPLRDLEAGPTGNAPWPDCLISRQQGGTPAPTAPLLGLMVFPTLCF